MLLFVLTSDCTWTVVISSLRDSSSRAAHGGDFGKKMSLFAKFCSSTARCFGRFSSAMAARGSALERKMFGFARFASSFARGIERSSASIAALGGELERKL